MDLYIKAEKGGIEYPYFSGSYTNFFNTVGTITTQTIFSNFVYGGTFVLDKNVQVDEYNIRIVSGAVGNAVLGIYKLDITTPILNLIHQSALIDTSITGLQTLSIPVLNLDEGIYCTVVHSSVNFTASTVSMNNVANVFGDIYFNSAVTPISGIKLNTTYTGTLPPTVSLTNLGTNLNPINILFKIS